MLTQGQLSARRKALGKRKNKLRVLHDVLALTPHGYRNQVRREIAELKEQIESIKESMK